MKIPWRNWCQLLVAAVFLTGCAGAGRSPIVQATIEGVSVACPPRASLAGQDAPSTSAARTGQSVERIVVSADPESATSLVARAWDRSRSNDRDGTMKLLDLALARPDGNTPIDRIHWSYGWAMFNLNDHRCALAHFEQARQAAPEQIRWLPQTFAVTYWQMGEHDLAVRWYDEAVRIEPACWSKAKTAAQCSRRWLRQERRALGLLFTAWKHKQFELAEND